MRRYGFLALGLVTLFAGCDQFALKPKSAAPAPATTAAPAPAMPGTTGLMPPGDVSQMGARVSAAPVGAAPAAPGTQQEVAGVGSGSKGRSLDDPGVVTIIAQPAKSYFAARERITFEIQIPDALNKYKALDGEGNAPASHDEFMEKIIQAYQIPLPALPAGHRYVYDPKTEQLMVEKPVQK